MEPIASSTESTPRFSVIVATRGRQSLDEAIDSVLGQTVPSFELLIVNDGGPSLASSIARRHDGRIRLIERAKRGGPGAARRQAQALVEGQYVAYLDDDDLWAPNHLQTLLEAFGSATRPEVVYTDFATTTLEQRDGRYVEVARGKEASVDFDYRRLLCCNFIALICLAHSAERLRKTGGFVEDMPLLEDWELLLRLCRRARVLHVPRVTAFYRRFVGGEHTNAMRSETLEMFHRVYAAFPVDDPQLAGVRQQQLAAIADQLRLDRRHQLVPNFAQRLAQVSTQIAQARLDDAAEQLQRLTETLPDDGELLTMLAKLRRATGRRGDAEALIGIARQRDPLWFSGQEM